MPPFDWLTRRAQFRILCMSFMDKLREATGTAAARAKTELETLQKRRELTQAYTELGRKTAELVEAGKLTQPSLAADGARLKQLRSELEALGGDASNHAESEEHRAPPETRPA